ncbi:MAG: DNA polymerase III subunit delta' [Patescibacteria group bacterium]|nr:DNA polymerase III subunit delta' [Patescibacteria group bacterium]
MLIGHQKQWEFLIKAIEQDNLSHAYLFSGYNSLGKKTVALEFVKFLNCENKKLNHKPCQSCRKCRDIGKNLYPDLMLIEPNKQEIQISQIREAHSFLSLKPYFSQFKIIIINHADFLNQEAQSSLLKLLEEPKGETIFILIAEFYQRLFPTILSRVESLKFYSVPENEIEKYLRENNISENTAKEISSLSFGMPGKAIDFLNNPQKIEDLKKTRKEIIQLSRSDIINRFQYVKTLLPKEKKDDTFSEIYNLKEILGIWLRCFREALLLKIKGKNVFMDYSLLRLIEIIRAIDKTIFWISSTNVNRKLALENLMLEL